MTKKLLFTLLSVFLSVMTVVGQVTHSVNVSQPGGLSAAIGTNLKTVTDLTLMGSINATDFETIKQMTALQNLNMEKVSVVDNTIPANAFEYRVLNSLNLPSSILSIEDLSFYQATIENFDLSSLTKLEKIGHDAFNSFKSHSLDFTKCLNIKEIGYHAFMNLNLTKDILDFSSYSVLPRATIAQSGPSLFSNFGGTVILSPNLKEIPDNSFYQFKGSVALPQGLEKIGNRAFQQSTIKELNLPSSILSIEDLSFYQATIENFDLSSLTKLEKIGHDAFNSFKSHSLDFTKCLNIKEIGYHAFMNLNLTKDILDFSSYSVLPRATIAQSGPSLFSNFGGTVILSPNLKEIPDNSFYQFKGSVALPQGLEKIGNRAFQQSTIKELNLPSSILSIEDLSFYQATIENFDLSSLTKLEKIGHDAFNSFKSHSLDFTKCLNIKEIGYHAFMNLNLTKDILDFSSYSVLPRATIAQSGPSLFSNFGGTVILSPNLKEIPDNSFYQFKGSVALPQGLEKIGNRAFQQSTLKSIELPSSVTKIENNAFLNASQLEKIISNNPTPPALGNNVFGGVNKENTVLEVPKESVNLYGTADQWKDFLNVKSTIPSKLNLTYKINGANWGALGDPRDVDLEYPYEGVRIGEYYWMNTNFNHVEKARIFSVNGLYLSGVENNIPLTQSILDKYLDQVLLDKSKFQVDIDQFTKDYGNYYSIETRNYMRGYGKMFENNKNASSDWNMPTMSDVRQLFAMSPFAQNNTSQHLSHFDVMYALNAKSTTNEMSKYVVPGRCGSTYWFNYGDIGGNKYDFSLMPNGARQHADFHWNTILCTTPQGKYEELDAPKGHIFQTFYVAYFATQDGTIVIHDQIGTDVVQNTWQTVRWCRVLSDEELGYKLYISIPNVNKNIAEWNSFVNGNEIPLLNYLRNNCISTAEASIIKLGLNESAPSGYIELPHGYLRGFYVQYILDKPSSDVTVGEVIEYAYNVEDSALQYDYNNPKGRESLKVCKSTTRSISTDDVVIPFRTSSEVSIYPNPVQDVLNVSGEGVEKISLYDLSGRQLQSVSNASSIQMSGLTSGTYIVRVQTASGESVHKVMKK